VVDPERPRVVDGERPAEANAAIDAEAFASREREVNEREERLVPPNGDPVLTDAAESLEDPLVEFGGDRPPVLDGRERLAVLSRELVGERLDLEPVDARDGEALVEQVVRERVAGGR
jgi:hypothetical protein